MRLVIARCSVDYIGRLTAHLPMAPRLVLIKADGSVSIHADDRAFKPLNWMNPPCRLKEDGATWTVTHGKTGEKLVLTMDEILHDSSHELGVDPGLTRCGLGVVEGAPGSLAMVAVGVVRTPGGSDTGERLAYLQDQLDRWLDRFEPDAIALERVYATDHVPTVMRVFEACMKLPAFDETQPSKCPDAVA